MDDAKILELLTEALEGFPERVLERIEELEESADERVPSEPAEA